MDVDDLEHRHTLLTAAHRYDDLRLRHTLIGSDGGDPDHGPDADADPGTGLHLPVHEALELLARGGGRRPQGRGSTGPRRATRNHRATVPRTPPAARRAPPARHPRTTWRRDGPTRGGRAVAQFKVYGRDEVLRPLRGALSDALHAAAVDVLGLPAAKRFHRFFPMSAEDFPTPEGRSERYTIVEVLMFAGRTTATKKAFYRRLYRDFEAHLGIDPVDLEITVVETPRHDWGIRGRAGDELTLTYRVEQ